jgi:hypothetical protein
MPEVITTSGIFFMLTNYFILIIRSKQIPTINNKPQAAAKYGFTLIKNIKSKCIKKNEMSLIFIKSSWYVVRGII